MNKPSTRRKPEHSTVHCRDLCGGSTTGLRHVLSAMPELAEVEWYRKQWNPARGDEIVDVRLHPRNRVFRGTNARALQESLVGEKLLNSGVRGKRMLFQFSGDSWLGIHLGMTGKIRVESASFRPNKHDHLVLYQRERALVFTDSRQFGRVRFYHGSDKPDWWKSDVPEIMSPAFNQKFVDQFLDRHRRAPIKPFCFCKTASQGSAIGWLMKSCGGQRCCLRNEAKN